MTMKAETTTKANASSRKMPIPRSIRGKVPIDPKDQELPEVLHPGPPSEPKDRIRNRRTYRVTPVARVFIIQLINTGYSNRQINAILRQRMYILQDEPDLSVDCLGEIRALDECQLDVDMLSREANQVAYRHIGKFVIYWAELGDAACRRLLGRGSFGDDFEHLSVGECLMVAKTATGLLMDTFGLGLGERIKAEFDHVLALQAGGKVHHFTEEEYRNLLERHREGTIRGVFEHFEKRRAEEAKAAEAASLAEEIGGENGGAEEAG